MAHSRFIAVIITCHCLINRGSSLQGVAEKELSANNNLLKMGEV